MKRDGRVVSLGPKASFPVEAGDVFHIETPGMRDIATMETLKTPYTFSLLFR
jgi:hypothetical protein